MKYPDHHSTKSAVLVGSNDDLLTEILLRLPVTSILRFKSVSKHWHLFLSHKHFTHRYDKLSRSPGTFVGNTYVPFDVENGGTPPFRSLDFHFDPYGIRILQSCNGLLLCCTDRPHIAGRKYYVLNPTTTQFAVIPSVPGSHDVGKSILFMGLAYHQIDCVHYKVICIRRVTPGVAFQILMYSSDTGKWKVSVESFYTKMSFFSNGVYLNGAVYWAPSSRGQLYFKIDVEQPQTLPFPVEMMSSVDTYTRYFGESRGHLHLIVANYPPENYLQLNVYEMLSDHSGWFVKYQVELDGLPRAFPDMFYRRDFRFNVSM